MRPNSTEITEPSIFYTRSIVQEHLLRQPSKTALDTRREPGGQRLCSSMHAMVIVIHHHNIGLNQAESITSLSFTRIWFIYCIRNANEMAAIYKTMHQRKNVKRKFCRVASISFSPSFCPFDRQQCDNSSNLQFQAQSSQPSLLGHSVLVLSLLVMQGFGRETRKLKATRQTYA